MQTCAGETVYLAPANSYDQAVVDSFAFGLKTALQKAGPAAPYWRKSVCNAQGNFQFKAVPNKQWLVITQVGWEVLSPDAGPDLTNIGRPQSNIGKTQREGGMLIKRVALSPGTNGVILSGDDIRKPLGNLFFW